LRNIFLKKKSLKNEYNEFRNTITKLLIPSSNDLAHQDQDHQSLFFNLLWSLIVLQFSQEQDVNPRSLANSLEPLIVIFNAIHNWISVSYPSLQTTKTSWSSNVIFNSLNQSILMNIEEVNDFWFDCAQTMILKELSWKTH
jgi:hypothetical protein